MNSRDIALQNGINPDLPLPVHVAIIMDGNGRWAKAKMLLRSRGHENGAKTVREVVKACVDLGVPYLTLFAFSTENWGRPQREIDYLMSLLERFLISEKDNAIRNNIRLNTIGTLERLPHNLQDALQEFKESSCKNDGLTLTLALNYGGRDELIRAARALAQKAATGELDPATIDRTVLAEHLDTVGMPDPDIMLRTGGDIRISNFLLWQMAHAEFFVVPTLWPDFTRGDFYEIIRQFQTRERRFGKIKP